MNERIRELIQSQNSNRGLLWTEEDKEKFAKLLIRECVQTLIDNTPERYTNESAEEDWDKGYDQAMRDCIHYIREHFGVEE